MTTDIEELRQHIARWQENEAVLHRLVEKLTERVDKLEHWRSAVLAPNAHWTTETIAQARTKNAADLRGWHREPKGPEWNELSAASTDAQLRKGPAYDPD